MVLSPEFVLVSLCIEPAAVYFNKKRLCLYNNTFVCWSICLKAVV